MNEPRVDGVPLVNTRTTFQRTSDARFFTGRIRRLQENLVTVVCPVEHKLTSGESFAFQVFGAGYEASFFAKFRTEAVPNAGDRSERQYVFVLDGEISLREAVQNPRFTTEGLTASLDVPGFRRLENARVLDISAAGLSILSPAPMGKGETMQIGLNLDEEVIQAEVEVRYCVKDKTRATYHRIGLLLKGMDRISAIRWRTLYGKTVEGSRYHASFQEPKAS